MKKVLFIGDGVKYTGFSTVIHNIISNIPEGIFDIHHLAINYYGDPHEFSWKIYPASLGGDIYGINRLNGFDFENFAGIFILNDMPIVDAYLQKIKSLKITKIPAIIVYTPIDGYGMPSRFFNNLDIVKQLVFYTDFAKEDIQSRIPDIDIKVIPHGVNTKVFYRLFNNALEAKRLLFSNVIKDLETSFIVLNANRNQPRKRIDLTLRAFAKFAKGKPDNVKLYLHCGRKDVGWMIDDLATDLGLTDRVIMTQTNSPLPQIPMEALNLLYNATDVGINTAQGEGWGLTNFEHARIGVPQVVPNHTACRELFKDTGVTVDIAEWVYGTDMSVRQGIVSVDKVADSLEKLYTDKAYYARVQEDTYQKFSQDTYDWGYIVKNYWMPLFESLWR
ncbi:MAG: glycosyltransferase family 4 protein [Ignavibacterium sp.]